MCPRFKEFFWKWRRQPSIRSRESTLDLHVRAIVLKPGRDSDERLLGAFGEMEIMEMEGAELRRTLVPEAAGCYGEFLAAEAWHGVRCRLMRCFGGFT